MSAEQIISNKDPKVLLSPDEEGLRQDWIHRFERELRFIKHRGIRTRDLADLDQKDIVNFLDIFKNCVDKIKFLKDSEGKVVGWELKNNSQPYEKQVKKTP